MPSSNRRARRDNISRVAVAKATYSASIVERATTDCFLELHETGEPATKHTNPDVDLRPTVSPAQSESEKPQSSEVGTEVGDEEEEEEDEDGSRNQMPRERVPER